MKTKKEYVSITPPSKYAAVVYDSIKGLNYAHPAN